MNHFVYIKDLLAVKTNLDKFSWSYGMASKKVTQEDFDQCRIKVHVNVVPDKEVPDVKGNQFSYFTVDKDTVHYRRNFFGIADLRYSLRIDGNSVYMICGKNYFKLVRGRIMNMHSAGYILSDVVEAILLRNGLCTLYCSAVSFEKEAVCIFGAPNTGKTLTGILLCNKYGGKMVSEDFAVTDGETLWGAPWTNTHRNYEGVEGASGRVEINDNPVKISNVAVIQKGKAVISSDKDLVKVRSLNRYGLGYSKAPVLVALGYYNHEFDTYKFEEIEKEILERLVRNHSFLTIESENTLDFAGLIMNNLKG